MEKTIKYTWAFSANHSEGYILCSGNGAEEKAKQLIKNTPQLGKFDELMKVSGEIFLGMKGIKGGYEVGILVYTDEPKLISVNDFVQSLATLAMTYEDEM